VDPQTKGERAAQILENEVYQEAVAAAKQRLKDVWAMTGEADERDALWHRHKAIDEVTQALLIIRNNGIMDRKRHEKES
jgi:hypothetical protein